MTPGRPMDRETLTQAIAELRRRRAGTYANQQYGRGYMDAERIMEQLRDAAQEVEPRVSEGRCDTTGTERFVNSACQCATYLGNKGPCATYVIGSNHRCVYCDHELECHPAPVGGQTPTEPPRRIECDYLCSLCGDMHPLAMDCPIASLRATAPMPPGAPAPFTREDVERMANEACQLILQARDIHTRDSLSTMREMLLASAATVPAEGRQPQRLVALPDPALLAVDRPKE